METSSQIVFNLPNPLPVTEKEEYMHGCCHIFALALHELTNLKIAVFLEKRAIFHNDDGTKSSVPIAHFDPVNDTRQVKEVGEGLVHAVCLLDDTSDIVFDAFGIRHVDELNTEFEIRPDTYLKILANPNDILVYGHTLGIRDTNVENYVNLTKDYINTYLSDEIKSLKGKNGN